MPQRSSRIILQSMLLAAALCGALLTSGAPLVARQGGAATDAPAAHPPSAQHAVLHRLLGEWSAMIEVRAEGAGKPEKFRAAESVRACCNGLFVLTELRSSGKKSPRGGNGILGYDPARGRYLLAWADTRSGSLSTAEGEYDEENDSLTFVYEKADGQGGTQQVREVFAWDGPNRRSRTLFAVGGDGSEPPLVAIAYRRK